MKQDIRFKGLNLAIDEQAVENGALAVCDGMEMCGGALRPCVIEGVRQTAEINGEILYIHEMTNGRKNAIFAVDNDEGLVIDGFTYPKGSLIFQDLSSTEPKPLMAEDNLTRSIINSVTSNGNTLVMLTTKGIRYFRWYENTYKYLGKMPELELEFYLRESDNMSDIGGGSLRGYFENAGEEIPFENQYSVDVSEEDIRKRENLLMKEETIEAALGKLRNKCRDKNYFTMPFFVRYCYRLWDGRKVMHSAPVLLFSDITSPETVVLYHYKWGKEDVDYVAASAILMMQKLYFNVWNADVLNTIRNDWKDIIKSIDVYITPDISRRDETVKVDISEIGNYPEEGRWHKIFESGDTALPNSIIAIRGKAQSDATIASYSLAYKTSMSHTDNRWTWYSVHNIWYAFYTPVQLGDEQWKKRLVEQNAYYLLHRFDLVGDNKEHTPTSGEFPIGDGILGSIEAQEQMITSTAPDDYRTHNEIIAQTSYVYNNRINLTGIQEIPFNGFPMYCLQPRVERGSINHPYIDSIIVKLEDNGESVYVERGHNGVYRNVDAWYVSNAFVFFPDSRAKEMWLYAKSGELIAHLELEEHPFLNGAYHMGDFSSIYNTAQQTATRPDITENPRIYLRNYIFTSASGNPFVFPAAHRYAVGLGSVLAIASTTRALSQGQFGQYPLIAFATDGIYALEISSTGSYSGIQPISREVMTNPRSLLQLDQSIAFVTRRAVNQLVSSDVTSLSDMLNGALRDLSEMLKGREGETVIPSTGQVADLIGAMQDAQGIYDFVNSRLLYFLKDGDTFTGDVLVFCANDGAWAYKSLGDDIIKGIYNSYPYPYIHKTDGSIECLSVPYDNMEEGSYSGVVVTRTLKTEGVRNAIREFFQDYDFGADTDRPTLILWGSNDNRTWHYIGRSNARQMGRLPGRIYRYFRLAVKFENMKRNDLYHGVQLDIVERFTR